MRTLFILLVALQAQCHTPVWTLDIAPILYRHCTSCHNDNGIAPFSLVTYEETYVNRYSIAYSTKNLRMPPWPADPSYSHFQNERLMTADEIHLIEEWVRSSAPYGRPQDTPIPPVYTNEFWPHDLEIAIPEYTVPNNGDVYRCFPLPTGLSLDQFITSFKCIPGNKNIVHHILVYADTSNIPYKLDALDKELGYTSYWGVGSASAKQIGAWVPGSDPTIYPKGMGQFLAKAATIIIQVHYAPGSMGQKDQTSFLARLSSSKLRELKTEPLLNHFATGLFIPANKTTIFSAESSIVKKLTMISVMPHMHSVGKSVKVWKLNTAKDTTRIIRINNWNFHWQLGYELPTPLIANVGDVLQAEATYDNYTNRNIRDGASSSDEMMLVYFTFTEYKLGDELLDLANGVKTSSTELPKLKLVGYPNPARDRFNLPIEGLVCIYDTAGRVVKSLTAARTIDISDLSAGVYFVTVMAKSEYGYTKLIKL